jgi:hypothetical protein
MGEQRGHWAFHLAYREKNNKGCRIVILLGSVFVPFGEAQRCWPGRVFLPAIRNDVASLAAHRTTFKVKETMWGGQTAEQRGRLWGQIFIIDISLRHLISSIHGPPLTHPLRKRILPRHVQGQRPAAHLPGRLRQEEVSRPSRPFPTELSGPWSGERDVLQLFRRDLQN